jgi:acyl-coenzyme A synthetase/AMP-(fatty) acid ligase
LSWRCCNRAFRCFRSSFFTDAQRIHAIATCGASLSDAPSGGAIPTAPSLPEGTARITFTSGSTGTPKGICLSADHMMEVAASVVAAVGDHHAGRHLALLPPGILLETVAGLFATLLAGGTYVCPPQALVGLADPFRPDFDVMARAMAAWRITSTILVPEYLAGLVRVMEATGLRLPTSPFWRWAARAWRPSCWPAQGRSACRCGKAMG